jgi:hypothetical protein
VSKEGKKKVLKWKKGGEVNKKKALQTQTPFFINFIFNCISCYRNLFCVDKYGRNG